MKKNSENEFMEILQIVGNHPSGISLQELHRSITTPPSERTLLRRVTALVKKGSLVKQGSKRDATYSIPKASPLPSIRPPQDPVLSDAAKEIQLYLQQPNRPAAAYNRSFVDNYRPNQSFYLPDSVRNHLTTIGSADKLEYDSGSYIRTMLGRLLIDLSWNSSRLEGNSYSLLETERLIEQEKTAEGKSFFETKMVLNHKAAIEFLVESKEEIGFNRYTILNLHGLLSEDLLSNPDAEGRLRTEIVGIHGTVYQPPAIPQLIEEYFDKILHIAAAIQDPFEQAFFSMVQLPYLQPFIDVNKRVSRLAVNIPLFKSNLCPLSFIDVPQKTYVEALLGVYELNKIELLRDLFVWAYERSAKQYTSLRGVIGEPDPLKIRYRIEITEVVVQVVKKGMDKTAAIRFVHGWAREHISQSDQARFIEIVETNLLALHEGNIARYRLKLSEFLDWQRLFK